MIELKSEIIYHDEVLTMSTRLAANKGQNLKFWYDRYKKHEIELDFAIIDIIELSNDLNLKYEFAVEVDVANKKLVNFEKEAFRLSKQGDFIKSKKLLFSDEYNKYKKKYSSSINYLTNDVTDSIYTLSKKYKKDLLYVKIVSLLSIIALCTIWIFVLIRIRVESNKNKALFLKLNTAKQDIELNLKKLEEKNSELERFNFFIVHDLKEPLRLIYSYSQIIEKNIKNKENKDYLLKIQKSCFFINQLIEDLSNFGKTIKSKLSFSRFSINDIIFEIENDALTKLIADRNVLITLEDNTLFIKSDKIKLKQILLNIIKNAITYNTSKQPVIRINTEKNKEQVIISIIDNGIGIDEKYHKNVFDLFTRLNNKNIYQGSGIGLAICKDLSQKIGADIWIDKSSKNGTTFKISLKEVPLK